MRIELHSVWITAVMTLSVSLVGCGPASTETPPGGPSGTPGASATEDDHGDSAAHEHPAEGPHGGHLIELGNHEYYAELLTDERTHSVAVLLLDGAGEQPLAIAQPQIVVQLFREGQFVKYALQAVSAQGEAAGTASRFELVDADLCEALGHQERTRGRLEIAIGDKQYTGLIEHLGHDDQGQ